MANSIFDKRHTSKVMESKIYKEKFKVKKEAKLKESLIDKSSTNLIKKPEQGVFDPTNLDKVQRLEKILKEQ